MHQIQPAEAYVLVGDPSRANKIRGWEVKKHWEALAKLMVDAGVEKVKSET